MARLTYMASILLLVACSEQTNQVPQPQAHFMITPAATDTLTQEALSLLPGVVRACPGLDKYAADLSKGTVSEYDGSIDIQFSVSAQPAVLPGLLKIRSASNRCVISINQARTQAYIAKRACHSICAGEWQENGAGSMGQELVLQ